VSEAVLAIVTLVCVSTTHGGAVMDVFSVPFSVIKKL
jgi:hypothetical protein